MMLLLIGIRKIFEYCVLGGLGSNGTVNAVKRLIKIANYLLISKLHLFIERSQLTLTDRFRHYKLIAPLHINMPALQW